MNNFFIYLYNTYSFNRKNNELATKLQNYNNELINVKKSYVRYISHELRTPLNIGLIGINILEIELEKLSNNNLSETIKDIKLSYNNAIEILDNLLYFDKLKNNELILNCFDIKIIEFIDCIINSFIPTIKEKNIIFKFDYNSKIISDNCSSIFIKSYDDITDNDYIYIDKYKIIRVINNLLLNAIKFSPENKFITIILRKENFKSHSSKNKITPLNTNANCLLNFEIIANGCATDTLEQSINFKDLQTEEHSKVELMISKNIINLHNGTINISSTKVTIKLPLFQNKQLNILIVDDSKLNRKMLSKLLIQKKCICSEEEDGLGAVNNIKKLIQKNKITYDAIFMDFIMPNMDGPTATFTIRNLGYTKPIIGLTGNSLQTDIDIFISKGANKVILKPLNITELDEMLNFIKHFSV